MLPLIFDDREHAGALLAEKLESFRNEDAVILALPRGGLPVAQPIADRLGLPLDVIVAKKLGAPGNEEFAIGAVTAHGARILNEDALRYVMLPPGYLPQVTDDQQLKAKEREQLLRGDRPPLDLRGKVAILVDDGIATGMTMRAAIMDARERGASRVVVAAPVIAPDTFDALRQEADEVVAVTVPALFMAVGQFYDRFDQVSEDEALTILRSYAR